MIIPSGKLSVPQNGEFANIPVIAYGSAFSLRSAFLAGCCDFIRLPFTADELYFRILRNTDPEDTPLIWGSLQIVSGYIKCGTDFVGINHQQFLIIKMLLRNIGTPVSRESFQYLLWGSLKESSREIDMQISIIRRKLASLASCGSSIRTIRNFGYMIEKENCG